MILVQHVTATDAFPKGGIGCCHEGWDKSLDSEALQGLEALKRHEM